MSTRSFESVNSGLTVSGGTGLSANGAWTVLALVKPNTQSGTSRAYFNLNNGFSRHLGLWNDATGADPGLFMLTDGVSANVTFSTSPPNGSWCIIGASHTAGTTTPTGHYYNGTIWTHPTGSGTFPNISTAVTNASFSNAPTSPSTLYDWWRDCRIGAVAFWSGTALANATVDGMGTTAQSWYDATPTAMWRFNQANISIAVTDDIGDWDESNDTDTAVVADDPAFYNFTVTTGGGGPFAYVGGMVIGG